MIDTVIFWFTENRKKIGYVLGALNILGGISMLATGSSTNGLLELFVGSVLIFDAWLMP